ncbi:MAG: nucleotidyltransferase family protein [Pyrinomonadaceae bacterium]
MDTSEISALCISLDSTVREAMSCIDSNVKGIALVVDDQRRLLGTITDGDIRHAILSGASLEVPVAELLERKSGGRYGQPVTAPESTDRSTLILMMQERGVRQIPLLDDQDHVTALVTLDEFSPDEVLNLQAIVMAGGYGMRLRPLTEDVPKPMLPVGDRPLLELIVEQLRQAGIRRVNVATHYKSEVITEHFGNGDDFGVDIRYVKENEPLGTAGALSLLEASEDPLLVINGDILTRVDFRAMLNFHKDHAAELTVAVRQYEFRVPYGVIEADGEKVRAISEKPVVKQFINAGIYLLNPSVVRLIPNGAVYDIPDLIARLLEEHRPVVCFPVREYWLDIGKSDTYGQARADIASGAY